MTVIDLIIKLQQMPQNMEVMWDATHEGQMFKFESIDGCEEIETSEKEKFVVLHCGVDKYEQNEN